MQNRENLIYISDEKTIFKKDGDIEHFCFIETNNEANLFATNHEILALGYKVGQTKINVDEVKNLLQNSSEQSNF